VPSSGELFEQARASGFAFPESLDEWISGTWLEFAQRRSELPWLKPALVTRIRNFERVLNAYYPTTTLNNLRGWRGNALRCLSAWRYHSRIYRAPIELTVLQRLLKYQRPETSGF